MSDLSRAKQKIQAILNKYVIGAPRNLPLSPQAAAGKVYEAYVLAHLAQQLHAIEGLRFRMIQGSQLFLKSAPGPINRTFPYIAAYRQGKHVADLFTDTEFLGLSTQLGGKPAPTSPGDYHELDIMLVDRDADGRPTPQEIWLGIECKHTPFRKELLRGVLGLRRELSLLRSPLPTRFRKWPFTQLPADPPVALILVSSDARSLQYAEPGKAFGIGFEVIAI